MRATDREINTALRSAYETRRTLGYNLREPVNAFEIGSRLGIDIRFLDCPTLEGMYLREGPSRIFLPNRSHRPRGRLSFTCAHEIGHHQLGHGTTADRYFADGSDANDRNPEEQCADIFAAHLLMPRQAIIESFRKRGFDVSSPSAYDCFQISQELSVGLTSMANQLSAGLGLVGYDTARRIKKSQPKAIRQSIWSPSASSDLFVIDQDWSASTVDIGIGDYIAVSGQFDQSGFQLDGSSNKTQTEVYVATKRGSFKLQTNHGQAIEVRVSPKSPKSFTSTYLNSYRSEECK